MLSQHAIIQTGYSNMQLPNHRPAKLDMLSQHAVETNHRLGKSDTLSKHAQQRQAILAHTAKYVLHKRGCESPKQQTS